MALALACAPPTTAEVPPDCLPPDDIATMRAEWNSNKEATEHRYTFVTFCVEAAYRSVRKTAGNTNVAGYTEESLVLLMNIGEE